MILILVLWIFAALTLFLYATLHNARVDYQVSAGAADRLRALAVADSAVEFAVATLLEDDSPADGGWDLWHDNPERYREVALPDPGAAGADTPYGRFTVFTSDYVDDDTPLQYGPQDEAAKVNLNTAPRDVLLKLTPRMTADVAESILDWIDGDDVLGPAGAESSYYLSLSPPYRCKNAPFESVEEILYVRGVDAMLLYGEDWNRNGVLDPAENDGTANDPPDDADGRLELGLWHLTTVYSYDVNLTNEGRPRVNINTASSRDLQAALGAVLTADQIDAVIRGRGVAGYPNIAALLDLPGWDARAFQAAADAVTVRREDKLPGLVNVNTAPREVLRALPGMTDALADAVVAYRAQATAPLTNIGWLLSVMDRNALQRLAAGVTVRASQFSIQAVGWVPGRRGLAPVYARVWAVVDLAGATPRVLALKDFTPLGFPYSMEEED